MPGTGYPGRGYPGRGYPGRGYPGTGYPGTGYPPNPAKSLCTRLAQDLGQALELVQHISKTLAKRSNPY